jgi:2-hydroxy-6-oxo-6-(2'-aminophenyl)hexa-2,4-dienoate hydrolase
MESFSAFRKELESRYIDAGGIRTHYFDVGTGHPLILMNGGGAGADAYGNWYRTIPILRDSFRLIVPDMLGFGETIPNNHETFDFTQSARTKHLSDFIKALGLSNVYIVGNSMGGMTSMGTSIEYPGLISKLILMGSAGLNKKTRPEMAPVANYDFTREGMEKIVKVLAHASFPVDQEMVDYRTRIATQPATRAAYKATMGWVKQQGGLFYEESFIQQVSVPTLVIGGKNDIVVPLDLNVRYLELIPQSWGFFIPNCGHWAMLEHPKAFSDAVRTFLLG